MRRDFGVETFGYETDLRARMFENIAQLLAMKFGVCRYRGKPGVPDAKQQLDIIRAILRDDGDALAGFHPELLPQRRSEPRRTARYFIIIPENLLAVSQSRPVAVA